MEKRLDKKAVGTPFGSTADADTAATVTRAFLAGSLADVATLDVGGDDRLALVFKPVLTDADAELEVRSIALTFQTVTYARGCRLRVCVASRRYSGRLDHNLGKSYVDYLPTYAAFVRRWITEGVEAARSAERGVSSKKVREAWLVKHGKGKHFALTTKRRYSNERYDVIQELGPDLHASSVDVSGYGSVHLHTEAEVAMYFDTVERIVALRIVMHIARSFGAALGDEPVVGGSVVEREVASTRRVKRRRLLLNEDDV